MATPARVAKDLKRSAQRIGRLRVDIVADAAEAGVETASSIGGTFRFGRSRRPSQMTATVTEVRNRRDTSTARLVGVPVGAWVMKSSGRRGGYTVKATSSPLGIGANPVAAWSVHVDRPTSGDGRWSRVVDAIEQVLDDADERIGEALDD